MLVQRIKAETKTASGIFLPESAVKELNEAKVLAVGPGGLDKDGKRVSCGVKPGDRVLIPQVCFYPFFIGVWVCGRGCWEYDGLMGDRVVTAGGGEKGDGARCAGGRRAEWKLTDNSMAVPQSRSEMRNTLFSEITSECLPPNHLPLHIPNLTGNSILAKINE